MIKFKKKPTVVNQNLIDEVNSYVESMLRKTEVSGDGPRFSRELPDIRYSRKDLDGHMNNLLRIVELGGREPTFSEELIRYMKQRNYTASMCYKKAHVDRKLFSQITKNREYKPKKSTVIAFVLALGLDRHEAYSLMGAAGYTLSASDKYDLIIRYCIEHQIYDLDDVNDLLFQLNQPLLGTKTK